MQRGRGGCGEKPDPCLGTDPGDARQLSGREAEADCTLQRADVLEQPPDGGFTVRVDRCHEKDS
ncbi:MAG: hypothetical protein QOG80_1805, partial [Pseudonocardiales bacterium]|nr:hypothetical protein [Pseudonocardiales bacterium]